MRKGKGLEAKVASKRSNMRLAKFVVTGTTSLLQENFSTRKLNDIKEKQEKGSTEKTKRKREPRNFSLECREALHTSEDGWHGIPASAFRDAAIACCRLTGFKMTHAKMSLFVLADGYEAETGIPLVKINKGKWRETIMRTRNSTGVMDLRARPMWREWGCDLLIRYDADQFTLEDVTDLMERAGQQNGMGGGRHNSRQSNGLGFGCFTIKDPKEYKKQIERERKETA